MNSEAEKSVVSGYDSDYFIQQNGACNNVFLCPGGRPPLLGKYIRLNKLQDGPEVSSPEDDEIFQTIVQEFGMGGLQLFALISGNDYNHGLFPGIGIATAKYILLEALQDVSTHTVNDSKKSTALLADIAASICEEMDGTRYCSTGKTYESTVRGLCEELGSDTLCEILATTNHNAVHVVLEICKLCFNCMAVVDSSSGTIVHATDPALFEFKTLDDDAILSLSGVGDFDSHSPEDLQRFQSGELDPRTLKPWVLAPGIKDAMKHDPAQDAGPSVGLVPAVPEPAASDKIPSDLDTWSAKRCKEWLTNRVVTGFSKLPVRQLRRMIKMCLELGFGDTTVEEIEKETKRRALHDRQQWELVKRTRDKGRKVSHEDQVVRDEMPALGRDVIQRYFLERNANTSRNEEVGLSRRVSLMYWHREQHYTTTADGIRVRKVYVSATVGQSIPGAYESELEKAERKAMSGHEGRVVVTTLLAVEDTQSRRSIVASIDSVSCLIPETMLSDDGAITVKKGYRPCRCAQACVHTRALLESLSEIAATCVDGPCQWSRGRSGNTSINKQQYLKDIPLPGNPGYVGRKLRTNQDRELPSEQVDFTGKTQDPDGLPDALRKRGSNMLAALYEPFSSAKLAEIDKGAKDSEVYNGPLRHLLKVKRKAQEDLSKVLKRRSHMDQRPFKIEDYLDGPSCDCRWSPQEHKWLKVCSVCAKVPSSYLYDRGLGLVHIFLEKGTKVYVPNRKRKGQVVWTPASSEQDRNVSRPRTNVERNMKELREFGGFDSKINLRSSALVDAEAQVARGMCNLRPCLTDWLGRGSSRGFEF